MASGRVRFEALDDTPASQGVLGAIVCSALLGAAAIALAYVFENQLGAEKVATLLVQPVGAIWVVLFGCIWMAWRRHATLLAIVLLLTWFWITLWGNGLVAGWLQGSLENPYRKIQPMETERDELDAIALLGGGTSAKSGKYHQISFAKFWSER